MLSNAHKLKKMCYIKHKVVHVTWTTVYRANEPLTVLPCPGLILYLALHTILCHNSTFNKITQSFIELRVIISGRLPSFFEFLYIFFDTSQLKP